ncbi:hypothetical protein PsorP6_012625 [Peronosclerospora sorghi]|uniref:Uncharacterized protein n=1 Tax=Peronosclerospora sorghi TaxID=230839 RepID=A0ACC0WF69_9STRA|nr:hypothetical protein PsorP6_012625 [Peronosclerospora sorghi]
MLERFSKVHEVRLRWAKERIWDGSLCWAAIIMIGVGDGPWTLKQEFDNKVPERLFDNFQFVNNKKTFFITGELQETLFLHERTNGVVVIWNSLKRSCFAKGAAHY